MKKSRLLGSVCACFVVLSFNAAGAVISVDSKNTGDNLLIYDTASGLKWLDLTETNDMSRDYVITQLDSGGDFDGFRYVTTVEVLALWSNFGIDLSAGGPLTTSGFNPGVIDATSYIGNILCEWNCTGFPNGALGITADKMEGANDYEWIGAYHYATEFETTYANDDEDYYSTNSMAVYTGSYLVVSQAPLPAALWLFGSGLLGLIGLAWLKGKPSCQSLLFRRCSGGIQISAAQ